MKKVITIVVIVLVAVGLGYYLFTISPEQPGTRPAETFDLTKVQPLTEPAPVTAEDHIKGNPEAKNTLIIYEDFQCPACANYFSTAQRLHTELPDTRVVFRHYPLVQIHDNAAISAYASEAAAAQGKFWEMHDQLYLSQGQWDDLSDPVGKFVELAQAAGVPDLERFRTEVEEKTHKPRVEKDYIEALGLDLGGTPSIVFNGTPIENEYYGLENLKTHLQPLYKQ